MHKIGGNDCPTLPFLACLEVDPHLFESLLIKLRSAGKMVFTENVLPASDCWNTTLALIHSPEECERGQFRGNKTFKFLAVVRKFPFPTVTVF